MIFGQEAGRPGKVARVIPFALGGAVALACFALLGWDLAHHYIPYSQPPVRKPSQYLALIYLVLSGLSLWRDIKRRRAKQKAGVPGPGPVWRGACTWTRIIP